MFKCILTVALFAGLSSQYAKRFEDLPARPASTDAHFELQQAYDAVTRANWDHLSVQAMTDPNWLLNLTFHWIRAIYTGTCYTIGWFEVFFTGQVQIFYDCTM